MKKVGLADWRTSNGLPSASDPETEADRTPRESLLACMTANREPSNQGFETDREATVCSASRRFLLVSTSSCNRRRSASGEPRCDTGYCARPIRHALSRHHGALESVDHSPIRDRASKEARQKPHWR